LHGIQQYIKKNKYYKAFGQKLKNDLVLDLLGDYYMKFYYFFNDIQGKNFADKAFVRKILTNLDC
jgi:hypothetical protein